MADFEELRAGRQAAAACVTVLRELQLAAAVQNQENHADYRPHLRRLFTAVRDGFGPISRCWHGTLEIFSPPDSAGSSKSTPVTPVRAWQSAVLVFWQVVCYTPYAWSAIVSWNNWDDGFDPTGDDGPHLRKWDTFVWYHIRDAFASLDDKVWDRLIERVNKTSAEESSIVAGQPGFPVRPPRFPERMQPLPNDKYELEKLLRDVEGLIAEFENAQQHDEQIDRVTAMVAEDPSLLPDATRYVGSIQKVPVPNVNKLAQLREFRIIEYASYLKQLVASNSENERIVAAMAKSREPSEQQSLLQSLVANQRDSNAAFDNLLIFLHRLRKEVVTKVEELATTATTELIRGEVPGATIVDELSRIDTTPRQPNADQPPGKKKRERTHISREQLEKAIRVFVAERQETYDIAKKARAENRPKSKQIAQTKFGRNALAKAVTKVLGKKIAPSRITASKAWKAIKQDLLLNDPPSGYHRGNKIGLEIAVEHAAEKAGDTTKRAVLDHERIERINAELPEAAASKLISQYQLGDIDENGIELILEAHADHEANPPDVPDDDWREARPRRRKSQS